MIPKSTEHDISRGLGFVGWGVGVGGYIRVWFGCIYCIYYCSSVSLWGARTCARMAFIANHASRRLAPCNTKPNNNNQTKGGLSIAIYIMW